MEKAVNIDFEKLGPAFREYVREKAAKANNTIVYYKGKLLLEENPKTGEKKILEEHN